MRALGRVLLVAVFLFAQASALAHQVWHLGSGSLSAVPVVSASQDVHKAVSGNPLCEQHEALGTVLGGLSSSIVLACTADVSPVHFFAPAASVASIAALAPSSRGPPALS
ncbi:MAG TPA: hypothetical protein VFX09_08200 [Burkholderiales bacterium]|nr:hypothetical protein [Burkholderiales bacterium]